MISYKKYIDRSNAPMPKEHLEILRKEDELSTNAMMQRNEINQLFDKGYLLTENGFCRNEDGSAYIAVLTKMPKVKIDMINWWFWWHAAEGARYQIWYPDMHYDISADFQGAYEDTSKTYQERLYLSTHLVTEDIGLGKDKLLIDFMDPVDFGFDKDKLNPDKNTIICARVGSPSKGAWATEMCHFVRRTEEGVEMRSRFWIGNKIYRMGGFAQGFLNTILNSNFVRKKLIPKEIGKCMFHHCSQEYHNLAEILPMVYEEYKS